MVDQRGLQHFASDLIELATRQNIAQFLAGGEVFRGWARGISGNITEGLAWIEEGIKNWMSTGARLAVPYYLTLKAEVLYLAHHTSEALQTITESENIGGKIRRALVVCRNASASRGVSRGNGCRQGPNRSFVSRSDSHGKAAEISLVGDACGSYLFRIRRRQARGVRRTRILA